MVTHFVTRHGESNHALTVAVYFSSASAAPYMAEDMFEYGTLYCKICERAETTQNVGRSFSCHLFFFCNRIVMTNNYLSRKVQVRQDPLDD